MAHPLSPHFKGSLVLVTHSNHLLKLIYSQGGCVGILKGIHTPRFFTYHFVKVVSLYCKGWHT
jgi:hypothetical protein